MNSATSDAEAIRKSASTRLLDLLAGWSAYVGTDEENQMEDAALTCEEISELYQEAGAQSLAWEQLNQEEEAHAVSTFITERVLPLVVGAERVAIPRSRAA